MKIAYRWLQQYLPLTQTPEQVAELLTTIGLEVEAVEEKETIKGGLKGLFVGQVIETAPHPNADKLTLTKVNVGAHEPLPIVCGAPNVAKGQKVVVATVGSTIYPTNSQPFTIKKAKIRGEVSEGMICAEDEIGLGTSHDGILVLNSNAVVGTSAAQHFNVQSDFVFEIGLTPNRADAMSHIGVARDLLAVLKQQNLLAQNTEICWPSVTDFKVNNTSKTIQVTVENVDACPRYAGITISNVAVAPSPNWLQNRLLSIGLTPINNIVDVTNFINHELGQPLHAFDADKISGNKVIVKTVKQNTPFVTLDEKERKLHENDLMICNANEAMCIAGVFGGLTSGVSQHTKHIFLESAYFNPVYIRKTAKRHGLNTDASFKFERGIDPNITIYALKRAALLIQQVAGGKISSNIIDCYPNKIEPFKILFNVNRCNQLIGKTLETQTIKNILEYLDIKILSENQLNWQLEVPAYRTDVQREADVVEEVLRIYGYNNIEFPDKLQSSLSYFSKPNRHWLTNLLSTKLTALGFFEVMNNSMTSANYNVQYPLVNSKNIITLENPLSSELQIMRPTLVFQLLENIAFNQNRRELNLKFFEFGKTYIHNEKIVETPQLAIAVTGFDAPESWMRQQNKTNFYFIKGLVENLLAVCGFTKLLELEINQQPFSTGISFSVGNKVIAVAGIIDPKLQQVFDIKQPIFYAEVYTELVLKLMSNQKVTVTELPKYPEVRRDLALLVNNKVRFVDLKETALKLERKLIKSINLFDVYEGKNLAEGKKSYAMSFTLRDDNSTLTDDRVDKVMKTIINSFQKQFEAELR